MRTLEPVLFTRSDVEWRDDMIRELRAALKFYADEKNYRRLRWYGELVPPI